MKNKKRHLTIALIAGILLATFAVQSFASQNYSFTDLGKMFKRYANNDNINPIADDLFAVGASAVITKAEVDQATEFYTMHPNSELRSSARDLAIEFCEQKEALYAAAVKNGFTATDAELEAFINDQKELFKTAVNKEDLQAVVATFDSEQDFWEHEYLVAKKNLPIIKYQESMRQQYAKEIGADLYSEEYIEIWLDYFEQLKENLVAEQQFVIQ